MASSSGGRYGYGNIGPAELHDKRLSRRIQTLCLSTHLLLLLDDGVGMDDMACSTCGRR